MAKRTLTASVQITPTTMAGAVDLASEPVNINFYITLQSMNKPLYRADLASYSAPGTTIGLLRL